MVYFAEALKIGMVYFAEAIIVMPNTLAPYTNDISELKVKIKGLTVSLAHLEKDISEWKMLKMVEELTKEIKELRREVKEKCVDEKTFGVCPESQS